MKKFIIEITEILQKKIKVNAESETDALYLIKKQYSNEEIVLNENNYRLSIK